MSVGKVLRMAVGWVGWLVGGLVETKCEQKTKQEQQGWFKWELLRVFLFDTALMDGLIVLNSMWAAVVARPTPN